MRLSDVYRPGRFGLSFELFPPKSPAAEAEMFEHVRALLRFRPNFLTCTYGAGGSTRDKTLEIVTRLKREHACGVASHLTCVGATVEQLRSYLQAAEAAGIDAIVALRGDPPRGETSFRPAPGGLRYASELVRLIRREFPRFGLAVAGYPEKHVEAPSLEIDLANLKHKVEQGADVVVTQLFYHNADFFRFRERCDALGIRAPLVPGLLPVINLAQIRRITALCGAQLPPAFVAQLEAREGDPAGQFETGVEFATAQLQELLAAGVPGVHFYVLNKSQAAGRVLEACGLGPK